MILAFLKKYFSLILILVLLLSISFGFIYYSNKIESISEENAKLEMQLSQEKNNLDAMKNMYSIALKQNEELQKNQKDALIYVSNLKSELNSIKLDNIDRKELVDKINEYEKCYSKNLIKNPSIKCYVKSGNGND